MKHTAQFPPLEDSELVLEELFRHTPVGVVLSDLHGTVIDVNHALCAMLDCPRTELIGRTLLEFYHPDDLADVLSRTADLREGRAGHYSVNRRYISTRGRMVHARVSVSVVYTKSGEPICGIGFIEDITEHVTMEAALRRSETLYRRVVEDQSELIARCLPDGTRTFVNEAYCRYNHATAEELLGTSFFTCMNEEEQRHVRAKFAQLTPAMPAITDQHWVTDPHGAMRWHEWTDRGFFDEEGRLVEIQSVGRDLTEEHASRELLIESETRYRRLFHGLPVAVWENDWADAMSVAAPGKLAADALAQVRVTTSNAAALAMAGVDTVEEFDSWLATAATPESAARYAAELPSLLFGSAKSIMNEYTLIRTNGEPMDVLVRTARSERWGQDWMTLSIAVDVSERKRIERELLHKQEMTERAEAAAHFGSWEWNAADDTVYGSTEFWRILDGDHGAGGASERPMEEVLARMHPDDASATRERWRALRAPSTEPRPAVFQNDYRLVRAGGSVDIARGQNFATYGPDGALVRAFGILRDITEATRAKEAAARHRDELVRADKMITLGILVSGMAHEINNPNHTIGLNVPLVRDAWREATTLLDEMAETRAGLRIGRMPWSEARQEVADMLEDIELASDRIRNIVMELRGYALDHDPEKRTSVSVNDIVNAALRLLGKHIARATKDFALELGDVPLILGNARRLEQVVVNLVMNACQALQSDEQAVRVSTGVDGGRVFIRVRDEGRGMTQEHLANIRTPFFTTRRAAGGTGLGVPVSDRIAGEHGGELTFETQPGHGMTATLWLPLPRT